MARVPGSGAMNERLEIQTNAPTVLALTITRVGTVATGTTTVPHQFLSTDYATIVVDVTGYNGKRKVTVLTPTTFTFVADGSLTTPATGTAVYLSDAQSGRRAFWRSLDTIYGEMIPQGTSERVQREAVQSSVDYRFRVYERDDITAKMRALWSPSWGASRRTLEIVGRPLPCEDGRTYMYLEMSEAGA